jgi:hypothetical protein
MSALEAGYRHIDTAAYGNARQVGEAVAASGLDRSEVFLETKIWISDYGYDQTLRGFAKSARKLGVDQIDLLVLHQALPSQFDGTLEAYRALDALLADGKVRAIGVSNFMVDHLTRLLDRGAGGEPDRGPSLLRTKRSAGPERRARHPHPGPGPRSAASPSTATASTLAPCRTRPSATSRGRPIDEVRVPVRPAPAETADPTTSEPS